METQKSIEVGKTYRHKKAGSVIKVKGEYGEYFSVVLLVDNNMVCASKPMLLPKNKADEWIEEE